LRGEPADIVKLLTQFTGPDLTRTLSGIEGAVRGITSDQCAGFFENAGAGRVYVDANPDEKLTEWMRLALGGAA